jgi:hypothetical protein
LAKKGKKLSLETRKRMSIAQLLRYKTRPATRPNLGKKLPKEWYERISESLLQFYSKHQVWNKGVSWPDGVKQNISKGRTGQPKRKGWTWSEESKTNRSVAVKAAWERKKNQEREGER